MYLRELQLILKGNKNNKIVLFGAGKIGRIVMDAFCELGIEDKVRFFIDNNGNDKDTYKNKVVYSFKTGLSQIEKDDLILITSSYHEEIIVQLNQNHIAKYLVCDDTWYIHFYSKHDFLDRVDYEVEFYLIDAFEIYHFYPVYLYLKDNGIRARMIAENPKINTSSGDWFNYEEAIEILEELEIEYKTVCNPYAKWAITTQDVYILSKYQNLKISMVYGASVMKNNYWWSSRSSSGFDYKFVHSETSVEMVEKYIDKSRVIAIGYPKHNNCVQDQYSRKEVLEEFGISTEKPILVYLPTWDEYSSIVKFQDNMTELKDKYYIVTKMHHCTERLREKENDRDVVAKISDKIVPTNTSLEKVVCIADVFLTDAKSGVATEVSYLRPEVPNVLLWSVKEKSEDIFVEDVNQFAPIIGEDEDVEKAILESEGLLESKERFVEKYYGAKNRNYLDNILKIFEL